MHCNATTPIRGYLDNYHSANLDQAYYYSPCCACNDLPPSRPSWKVQNSNLICRHSLRKLVPEVRERWLFMICIWDAFWLHFLHFHTVATGHGILNPSFPPAWIWRPHTFSLGFFLSFRCFLRNLPAGHFANFVRVGLRFSETSRLACLYLGDFETALQNLFIALEGLKWRRGS